MTLEFRNRTLLVAILGFVYDYDEPVPWSELVECFTAEHRPWKTVENTIYDLIAFGALHRVGKVDRRADTRAVKPTELGRAWLERELLPLPTDPDPFEEAEAIAKNLGEDFEAD